MHTYGVYILIWYLPRDAMSRPICGLCCRLVSVCLSVRPSVRHVRVLYLYPDGWRLWLKIVKLLSQPGSPISHHSSFFYPDRRYPIPRGTLYTGVRKFVIFDWKSPFISESVRYGPVVATER